MEMHAFSLGSNFSQGHRFGSALHQGLGGGCQRRTTHKQQ